MTGQDWVSWALLGLAIVVALLQLLELAGSSRRAPGSPKRSAEGRSAGQR